MDDFNALQRRRTSLAVIPDEFKEIVRRRNENSEVRSPKETHGKEFAGKRPKAIPPRDVPYPPEPAQVKKAAPRPPSPVLKNKQQTKATKHDKKKIEAKIPRQAKVPKLPQKTKWTYLDVQKSHPELNIQPSQFRHKILPEELRKLRPKLQQRGKIDRGRLETIPEKESPVNCVRLRVEQLERQIQVKVGKPGKLGVLKELRKVKSKAVVELVQVVPSPASVEQDEKEEKKFFPELPTEVHNDESSRSFPSLPTVIQGRMPR